MNDIKDILDGWAKLAIASELTPTQESNMKTCDTCPARRAHWKSGNSVLRSGRS